MHESSFVCPLFVLCLGVLKLISDQQYTNACMKIQELLSRTALQEAGLHKLSPQQLSALNRWLADYTMRAIRIAAGKSVPEVTSEAKPPGEAIESHIDGSFQGWSGETVFKLENGQYWQQTDYDYEY